MLLSSIERDPLECYRYWLVNWM